MLVLPNSYERYLASLRYLVSLKVSANGSKEKYLKNLKKIYIAEAIYNKNTLDIVDINKLVSNLLGSAKKLNPNISFKSKLSGNILLNKKLFSCLLLSLTKKENMLIFLKNDYLCIKFQGSTDGLFPILFSLKGYSLYEISLKQNIIIIPIKRTDKKSDYIESEWEYLFDKYSPVNLFINN